MLLHLMYKALIEMSPTREEFLSRLFSRPIPAGTSPTDTRRGAADRVRGGGARRRGVRAQSRGDLRASPATSRVHAEPGRPGRHRLRLPRLLQLRAPTSAIRSAAAPGWQPFPTYKDLMTADDGQGVQRGYLANEENYLDAARHARAQPDRPAGRRLRRAEGAALGRALPGHAPRDGERVLHVQRRAVSLPRRRVAAVLQQRRRAPDSTRGARSSAPSSTARGGSFRLPTAGQPDPQSGVVPIPPGFAPSPGPGRDRKRSSIRSRCCSPPSPKGASATTTTSSSCRARTTTAYGVQFALAVHVTVMKALAAFVLAACLLAQSSASRRSAPASNWSRSTSWSWTRTAIRSRG